MSQQQRTSRRHRGESRGGAAPPTRHGFGRRFVAHAVLFFFFANPALAGTQTALGPVAAVAGDGGVTRNEPQHTTLTQQSHEVIYEWARDIQQPADHTLQFIQRSEGALDSSATALNRSPGESASHFFGRVQANGNLIFVNAAGIHFEDGSFVDVGGLIAAAGQLSNEDFLNADDDYTFEGLSGEVTAEASIHAGSVALLGSRVANFGQIAVPEGSLMMLAGDQIWLRQHDSPIIVVLDRESTATDSPPEIGADTLPAVENAGTIEAGRVRMAAGDLLSFAVRQSGRVRADVIEIEGGVGGLVEVSGSLDAGHTEAGGTGGQIDVTGDWVSVEGSASIDASGEAGGGRIRIGGDFGGGPSLRAARETYVGPQTSVRADALGGGNGGRVAVWADGGAQVYGEVTARGGERSGDGGFVETSGKHWLDARRAPDVAARAPNGSAGSWLLDPNNIEVTPDVPSCGSTPHCLNGGLDDESLDNPFFQSNPSVFPSVDDSKISASTIASALAAGSNVILTTQTAPGLTPGEQNSDIVVNGEIAIPDQVAAGSNVTLTLRAANDLSLEQGIVNTNPDLILNVHLIADDLAQFQNPSPETQLSNDFVGTLSLDANIETRGGAVLLEAVQLDQAAGTSIVTDGGSFETDAFAGTLHIGGRVDTSNTSGPDNLDGTRPLGGALLLKSTATRRPLDQSAGTSSSVFGGDIVLADSSRLVSAGGTLTLTALGGAIALDGPLESGGGAVAVTSQSATFASNVAGESDETAGGRIRMGEGASISSAGGAIDLSATVPAANSDRTELEIRGLIDSRDTSDLTKPGGDVTLIAEGEQSRIIVSDTRLEGSLPPATPQIVTNGGDFLSSGQGDLLLRGGIDTRPDASIAPGDAPGVIQARHRGRIAVVAPDSGQQLALRGGDAVQLIAGTDGAGNLDLSGLPGQIALWGDSITLAAGDGFSVDDGDNKNARVALDPVQMGDRSGAVNPNAFFLIQDATVENTDIPLPSQFANANLSELEYTIDAWDGSINIGDASRVAQTRLSLAAADGLSLQQGPTLRSFEFRAPGDFTIDTDLASKLDAAAPEMTIVTGARSTASGGTLRVDGSLTAADKLTLHAGSARNGDLELGTGITLGSDDLTLWAGSSAKGGNSKVTVGNAHFATGQGAAGRHFTLRQDASIDDATLPNATNFGTGGVAGIDYRLRSDSADIALATAQGAAKLWASDLSLHAMTGVTLGSPITIASLDIGGLGSFTYDKALNDQIDFTDPSQSRLTLRAGLSGTGNLSFSTPELLEIRADEIRLVAGDGPGGNAFSSSIQLPASNLRFAPRTASRLARFVFRQDDFVDQTDLPSLTGYFGGLEPDFYGIRSDDGVITIDDFSGTTPLPRAGRLLVLSSNGVTLRRQDGEDLDLAAAFALRAPGTNDLSDPGSLLQIRSGITSLEATYASLESPPAIDAKVLPSAEVTFTGFDATEPLAGELSTPLDFITTPATAPTSLSIAQDATILASDLIDPARQLGNNAVCTDPTCWVDFGTYLLTSRRGDIEIAPDKVTGSKLSLVLTSPNAETGGANTTRNIVFGAKSTPDAQEILYRLASLEVQTEGAWKLAGPLIAPDGAARSPLRIEADDFIQLQTGLSGSGDLGFETGVTLQAKSFWLGAGADLSSQAPGNGGIDPVTAPVVDARSGSPIFRFVNSAAAGEKPNTSFTIVQHGALSDTSGPFAESTGLTPLVSQLLDSSSGEETQIGNIRLVSFAGDIRLERLNAIPASVPNRSDERGLPASTIHIDAGSQRIDEPRTLALGPSDPAAAGHVDTDLTLYRQAVLIAPQIELSAGGSGVVRAEADSIFLRGQETVPIVGSLLAPNNLRIRQDQTGFDESDPAAGCTTGCLPRIIQFGSTLDGVGYTIESNAGAILLDDRLAGKLRDSDLTLIGHAGVGPDVRIAATPAIGITRGADLVLGSLVVGEENDPAGPLQIEIDTDSIETRGDQAYHGNVTLARDLEDSGANIGFFGGLAAPAGETRNLTLTTSGQVRFAGDVDLGRNASDPSELRVEFDRAAQGTPSVRFGRDAATTLHVRADKQAYLAVDRLAGVSTPAPRTSLFATLYKSSGRLEFESLEFLMGQGEKLSIAGAVDIRASQRARLGDISAFDLSVTAPQIELLLRPAGEYLDIDGSVRTDAGLDYVTNSMTFSAPLTLIGAGRRPAFAIPDTLQTPTFLKNQTVTAIHADGSPLSAADFSWTLADAFPDLHPQGPSRDDISDMYFDPQLIPAPGHWLPDRQLPADNEALARLGIRTQAPGTAALRSRLRGVTLIDDVGSNPPGSRPDTFLVSQTRVLAGAARKALELYVQLFGEHGESAPRVRRVLQEALERYHSSGSGGRVVGFEFRRYVKNRPSSQFEAYRTLENLDKLFTYHRHLGLTPGEYEPIQRYWIERIRPPGIRLEELAEAIHPSRYVRGSDILDIFGD